jgi:molecular chaperone GrpE (heat shock protein)
MKKLYCNEYTGESFTTEEACAESEKKYLTAQEAKKKAEEEKLAAQKKKESERAVRAKEVEAAQKKVHEARKALQEAQAEYRNILDAFCRDYQAYHMSVKPDDWFGLLEDFLSF